MERPAGRQSKGAWFVRVGRRCSAQPPWPAWVLRRVDEIPPPPSRTHAHVHTHIHPSIQFYILVSWTCT
eukprot:3843-Chlamydomonas_euryale.AAC.1